MALLRYHSRRSTFSGVVYSGGVQCLFGIRNGVLCVPIRGSPLKYGSAVRGCCSSIVVRCGAMGKRIGKEQHGCFPRPSLGVVSLWVALSAALVPLSALAQARPANPPGGAPKPTAQDKRDAEVDGKLVACWQAFYSGKYEEAATQAEALAKLGARYKYVMIEAQHLCARANLAAGTKQSVARAQQIWRSLEKDTSTANKIRIQIAKSLQLEAQAQAAGVKPDVAAQRIKAAIDTLEPLLKDRRWNSQEVEAALVLANLYSNRSAARFDDARKMLDYVVSYLGDANNIQRMELSPELAKTYIEAAQSALSKLKYSEQLGLTEFEAAERLRHDKKFAEAQKAYTQITKDFPNSDFAPRSELHIGDCYIGLRQPPKAIEHWKKFVSTAPAGPWRAQAYVSLIDNLLEGALDLNEAGKYAELARASLSTALADEKAGPSWKNAEFDLCVRAGIVAFCRGKNAEAASAFTDAKRLSPQKTEQGSFDSLIAAARAGQSVIPDDVKGGSATSEKVAIALSIAVIHLATGRLDNADSMFDRVLGTPVRSGTPGQPARPAMQGATPAQLAFATFGKGAVLQAAANGNPVKLEQAKEQFLASIKAFGDGSWHSESLYHVAILAQEELNETFGISNASSALSSKSASSDKGDKDAKANKDRAAALFKAQQEVLGYWQELLKRYPKSPRVEYASWAIGQLQYEMAQVAPAEKTTQFFKDAALSANRFCETWPRSPLAGSAYRIQMTVATEYLFDLKQSKVIASQAAQWAKIASEGGKTDPSTLPPWAMTERQQDESQLKHIVQNCLLQAGLIAYLSGQFDQAAEWIDAAGPQAPGEDFTENPDLESIGLYYALKAIRSKKSVTDQQALDVAKTDEQRFILQLGDLYIESIRPKRAEEVFRHILDRNPRLGQIPPALEGYAMLQIATALDRQEDRRPEALVMLKKLVAKRELQGTHWGGYGLFRLALFTYNQTQDPKQAVPLYQQMLKQYPNHEMAELAHLYLCLNAIRLKDSVLAEKESQIFLKKYPKSEYKEVLQDRLSQLVKEKGKESK